jgi:hypothetical protein
MFLLLRRSSGFLHRAGDDGVGLSDRTTFIAGAFEAIIGDSGPELPERSGRSLVGVALSVIGGRGIGK